MKSLTLFRHAKSSWKFDLPDKDRPLKKRGINDAKLVSEILRNDNYNPDYIVCSSAKRTLLTSDIFFDKLKFSKNTLNIKDELYDFEGSQVLNFIKNLDDTYTNVLLFGHNYALTNIVNTYGSTYIDNVPTSGCVTIEFDIAKWCNLKQGKTIRTIFPRDLK